MDCAVFCTCIGTHLLLMTNQTFPNEQGTVYFAGGLIRERRAASLGTVSSRETDVPAFLLHSSCLCWRSTEEERISNFMRTGGEK
ncbi:unnamed protein product [Bubo scandiacus]